MSGTRIIGVILLALGVVLFIIGMVSSDSIGDQLSKTFTGEFTDSTTFMILGGIVSAIIGGAMTLFGGKKATS